MLLLSAAFFFEKSFKNTISMSNSLDPDQGRQIVGPYLNPNCFSLDSDKDLQFVTSKRQK